MQTLLARESVELGISRGRLRRQRWRRLVHGLYVPSAVEVDLVGRCRALQRILPTGAVYSELTAAALHGWWLPPLPPSTPICTAVPPERQPTRRPGMRGRRVALGRDEMCTVSGLPVTSPVRTLLDLAAVVCTVDLVVVVDSALRSGHCTEEELRAVGRERLGARGCAAGCGSFNRRCSAPPGSSASYDDGGSSPALARPSIRAPSEQDWCPGAVGASHSCSVGEESTAGGGPAEVAAHRGSR